MAQKQKHEPVTCVECDDPHAPYVILTGSRATGLVERHYCRVCYGRQP